MRTAEFSVRGFRVWVCDGAFGTRFSPGCDPWMHSGIGMVLRVSPMGTLGLVPQLSELNLNFERANAKTPQKFTLVTSPKKWNTHILPLNLDL